MQDAALALDGAKHRLERSGVLLEDEELLHAASHSANTAIVGSKRSKKTLSREEFEDMFEELDSTISRLSSEMSEGKASAHPNTYGTQDPCKLCAFAAVCRAAQKETKGEEQ